MTSFWHWWIIIITLGSIFGCLWLLLATRKSQRKNADDATTGHIYDGIEEFDNPMPHWWVVMFVLTIIFGLIYLVIYPGLGNYKGLLNWSQINQLEREIEDANQKYGPLYASYAATPIPELAKNIKAMKTGQRLFANNCAICHGSDAQGTYGFPNLTDNNWLYGGEPERIKESILHGRRATMPAWGPAIGDQGVNQVTAYVRGLSGKQINESDAQKGSTIFNNMCAACHGANGMGNQSIGAPNLTDNVWLYGSSPTLVKQTIRSGRNGLMPAHKDLLGEDRVHILSAYVYSLSHSSQNME